MYAVTRASASQRSLDFHGDVTETDTWNCSTAASPTRNF